MGREIKSPYANRLSVSDASVQKLEMVPNRNDKNGILNQRFMVLSRLRDSVRLHTKGERFLQIIPHLLY